MKYVFIDTNAYLGLYAFAADDLAQLPKLAEHIKNNQIALLITDQVRDEFLRNREAKIAETLKAFGARGGAKGFPNIIRHHEKYKQLTKSANTFERTKEEILKSLDAQIAKKSLPADLTFQSLMKVSKFLKTSPNDIELASHRMAIGNPPGKNGSLGDAINWEILLHSLDKNTNLYLVSRDKDYASSLGDGKLGGFLADEWKEKNGGDACLFSTLRELFERIAPEIKLSAETTAAAANSAAMSSNSAFGTFGSIRSDLEQTFVISFDPLRASAEDVAQNAISLALSIRPSQLWTTELLFEGCLTLSTAGLIWPKAPFIKQLANIPGVTAVSS